MYDAFVVRAKNELEARRLAKVQETGDAYWKDYEREFWLDSTRSVCEEVRAEGEPEIILGNFRAG
jgi:hypothetical protein